jgi:polyphosphate kinase
VVGRFLEHSRIYYFLNGGAEEVYLGSADMRTRNLDRRVEILFPIEDPSLVHRIREDILAVYFGDNVKARELRADGSYARVSAGSGSTRLNAQEWFIAHRGENSRK